MNELDEKLLKSLKEKAHTFYAKREEAVASVTQEPEYDEDALDSEDWDWIMHRNERGGE